MSPWPGEDDPRPSHDDDALPLVDLVIPDDARELDHEAELLRRERRRAARRDWLARRLLAQRWRRYGLSAPLIVAVLVFVGIFGVLLALLGPSRTPRMAAQPLASAPSAPVGAVGGLLVQDMVVVGGRLVDARTLRPTVFVLLPDPCRCTEEVRTVVHEAASYNLATYLVPSGQAPTGEVDSLASEAAEGLASVVLDPHAALRASYHPHGVSAVLVRADGIVTQVVRDVAPSTRLENVLQKLVLVSDSPDFGTAAGAAK